MGTNFDKNATFPKMHPKNGLGIHVLHALVCTQSGLSSDDQQLTSNGNFTS